MFPTGKPLFDVCFEDKHGRYIVAHRLLERYFWDFMNPYLRDYLDEIVGWRI